MQNEFKVTAPSQHGIRKHINYILELNFENDTISIAKNNKPKVFPIYECVHITKTAPTVLTIQFDHVKPYMKTFTFSSAKECEQFQSLLEGAITSRQEAIRLFSGPSGIRFSSVADALHEIADQELKGNRPLHLELLRNEHVLQSRAKVSHIYHLATRLAGNHNRTSRGVFVITNYSIYFRAYRNHAEATLGAADLSIPLGMLSRVFKAAQGDCSIHIHCKDGRQLQICANSPVDVCTVINLAAFPGQENKTFAFTSGIHTHVTHRPHSHSTHTHRSNILAHHKNFF